MANLAQTKVSEHTLRSRYRPRASQAEWENQQSNKYKQIGPINRMAELITPSIIPAKRGKKSCSTKRVSCQNKKNPTKGIRSTGNEMVSNNFSNSTVYFRDRGGRQLPLGIRCYCGDVSISQVAYRRHLELHTETRRRILSSDSSQSTF